MLVASRIDVTNAASARLPKGGTRVPLRVLTLTTLFPNASQPRHGIFIANRLARMRATGRVDPLVIASVPWFPGRYAETASVPHTETILGMPVHHPRYANVPAIGMRMQPGSLARALLAEIARNGFDRGRFDLVDAHYFYPDGVAAARVARALDLPLVVTARGSDINLIGTIAFARRRMVATAAHAHALIAVSEALARKMHALGMPAERIHVLRNGVDADLFFPVSPGDARERLRLDDHTQWVLGVGNAVAEKGFDLLVRAVARIDHAKLLLVGKGPKRNALRALAAAVAPGRVEFRDNVPQSELREVYSACDVLALPSLREGWPNVVLEAIACGTPVVASPVGGVPEILSAHAPAILVEPRDPAAWAEALRRILNKPRDAAAVRDYALRFGWDEVIDAQCALCEYVAGSHVKRGGA